MVRAYKYILKVIPLLAFIWGCAPETAPEGSDTNAESSQQNNGGATCEAVDLPDAPPAGGQLIFTVDDSVDPCEVSGYVVGYQEDLKVELANDGNLFINNIPPGEFDVVVGTLAVPALHLNTAKKKALRLGKSEFLAGVRKNKNKIDLPIAGGISGKVTLSGQTDHAGIKVYIPGTSFDATTDSNGNYTISPFVPVGINNLYFEKDGYHRGQIENIEVESDKITTVNDISLVLSTGAEGFILIEGGAEIHDSRRVKIVIGATDDAVLYKISESDTFESTTWKPIVTSTEFMFGTEGFKTLYVKFADANGLESSPFSDSISIDIFENNESKVVINKIDLLNYQLDLSIPPNAKNMKIVVDNEESVFEPVRTPYNLSLDRICGTRSLKIQFQEADLFESEWFETDLDIECFKLIDSGFSSRLDDYGTYGIAHLIDEDRIIFLYYNDTKISAYKFEISTKTSIELTSYTPSPALTWCQSRRNSQYIVLFGCGEKGNGNKTSKGAIYNIIDDSWAPISQVNVPEPRRDFSMAINDKKLFVWGGRGGWDGSAYPLINTGGILDLSTNTWAISTTINAPTARQDATMLALNDNKFWIWGGRDSASVGAVYYDTGAIYDATLNSWTAISEVDKPGSRVFNSAIQHNGKVYISGGRSFSSGVSTDRTDISIYDIGNQSWQTVENENLPTSGNIPMFIHNDRLNLWGGAVSGHWSSNGFILDLNFLEFSETPVGPDFSTKYDYFWSGQKMIMIGYSPAGVSENFNILVYTPWPDL